MDIQPINSEHDHTRAMQRIDALMEALPGTPEGDELDILATLVEAYEDKHFPVGSPDPVAAIEFRMDHDGSVLRATVPNVFLPKPGKPLWLMIRRDRCFVFPFTG